ncbi:hypothetical protein PQX77_018890 [Marasmius sp. AFHP31]|nr:hypothetical protein PQX77_018890 [Marasmius sp. AFHP31]
MFSHILTNIAAWFSSLSSAHTDEWTTRDVAIKRDKGKARDPIHRYSRTPPRTFPRKFNHANHTEQKYGSMASARAAQLVERSSSSSQSFYEAPKSALVSSRESSTGLSRASMLDHQRLPTWEEVRHGVHPENHIRLDPGRPFGEPAAFKYSDEGPFVGQRLEHTTKQDLDHDQLRYRYWRVGKYTLKPHQTFGIGWMLNRENPLALARGGIVADEVGTGKTLQALALIIDDVRRCGQDGNHSYWGTLIVLPLNLVTQWEALCREIFLDLKIQVYHGKSKPPLEGLGLCHIVITTYDTIRLEHATEEGEPSGALFAVRWRRIIFGEPSCDEKKVLDGHAIVDEAHIIRNRESKRAAACFALSRNSDFVWCLTATPIQNTVYDICSLLLVLNPANLEEFGPQIELMAVNGSSPLAKTARCKLRALLRPLLLRRLRNDKVDGEKILHLKPYSKRPPREIATCELDVNERTVYETLQDRICDILKHFGHREQSTKCVFVLILRLRQACLHPLLLQGSLQQDAEEPLDGEEMCELNELSQYSDDGASEMKEAWSDAGKAMEDLPSCKCGLVLKDTYMDKKGWQKHQGRCQRAWREMKRHINADEILPSSRMKDILKILGDIPEGERAIVFSMFPSFLRLLRKVLVSRGFKCVQYDGSMDRKGRDAALDAIKRGTGGVDIILMSMMAGSSGLNIAECNHVIFSDIWWNPAVEVSTYRPGATSYLPSQLTVCRSRLKEQAIGRVHRMGQTRKVHVHKLVAKNTIENRILEVQQGKRELAKKVLARGRNEEMGSITLDELRALASGKTS